MSRTKRDISHINQFEHDQATNSKRVNIIDTEIAIELDHKDGDSVYSIPKQASSSTFGEELDASELREVAVYLSSGHVRLEVSPDGEAWFDAGSITASTDGAILEKSITASKVRIVSDDEASSTAYLVGRS